MGCCLCLQVQYEDMCVEACVFLCISVRVCTDSVGACIKRQTAEQYSAEDSRLTES